MNFSSDMTSLMRSRKSRVGFRFHPTDQELIDHFLMPKIHNDDHENEDGLAIPEIKVCDYEPWELPDRIKKELNEEAWFFFSPCDYKYKGSLRLNRRTKAGFWKPTGKTRKVINKLTKKVIGTKRTLVFYMKQHPKPIRTSFVLHEYDVVYKTKGKSKFCLYKLKVKTESDETGSPFDITVNSCCEESDENEVYLASDCENYIRDDYMPDLISLETNDFDCQNPPEKQNGMLVFEGNPTPAIEIKDSEATCLEVEAFYDKLEAFDNGLNSTILSPPQTIEECLMKNYV